MALDKLNWEMERAKMPLYSQLRKAHKELQNLDLETRVHTIDDYSSCDVHDYNASKKDDTELSHLQKIFTALKNYEYSEKAAALRKKLNHSDFFSMILYLEKHLPPPSYLHLNAILLGYRKPTQWIDRLALFTQELEKTPAPDKQENEWLRYVRYSIREDSIRGFLKGSMGFGYKAAVISSTLAALDSKTA